MRFQSFQIRVLTFNFYPATCAELSCTAVEECFDTQVGGQCECQAGYERDENKICQRE